MGDASLIGLCLPGAAWRSMALHGAAWRCNHARLDGGWPRRAVDYAMVPLDEMLHTVDLLFATGASVLLVAAEIASVGCSAPRGMVKAA